MIIYIYSNVTGALVASHTAESNEECEAWADSEYGSNDYHWSYAEVETSNVVH